MNKLVNFFLPRKYQETYYEHLKSIGLVYIILISTLIVIANLLMRIGNTSTEGIYQLYLQPLIFILIFAVTLVLLRNYNPKIAKNFFGTALLYLQMFMMYITRSHGYAVEKYVGGFYIILVIYIVTALYMSRWIFVFNTLVIAGYTILYYKASLPFFDAKDLYLAKKGVIYFETSLAVSAVILFVIFLIFHKVEERERESNNRLKKQNEELQELLKKLQIALNTVTGLTDKITNLTNSLSQSAARQAAATEETAQAAEEFYQLFQQVVVSTDDTLALTDKTHLILSENKKAFESNQQVVMQIKEHVGFIQKIANKSDILAINASIEANKFGEEGKGFRVIAKEIRQLSEQILDYGEEIKVLVQRNFNLSLLNLKALDGFFKEFEKLVSSMQEISSKINTQKGIIDQINANLIEVNTSAQNTASATDELNEAIAKLNELTEKLSL